MVSSFSYWIIFYITSVCTAMIIDTNSSDQFQNAAITCLDDEPCTIVCDEFASCEESTISCPSNNTCDIMCTEMYSCKYAKISWPSVAGLGSLICDAPISCENVTFPQPVPHIPQVITCHGNYACKLAKIYCPANADCIISCLGNHACEYATIIWSETHCSSLQCISGNYVCAGVNPPLNTCAPTNNPSTIPTNIPSNIPTNLPTLVPTNNPSTIPTNNPSTIPTGNPSNIPTNLPTISSNNPSNSPTLIPTNNLTTNMQSTQNFARQKHDFIKFNSMIMFLGVMTVFMLICCVVICIIAFNRTKRKRNNECEKTTNNVPTEINLTVQSLSEIHSVKDTIIGNFNEENDIDIDNTIDGLSTNNDCETMGNIIDEFIVNDNNNIATAGNIKNDEFVVSDSGSDVDGKTLGFIENVDQMNAEPEGIDKYNYDDLVVDNVNDMYETMQ